MAVDKVSHLKALLIVLLLAIIITGSVVAWSKYQPSQPLEISLKPETVLSGEVYVGGGVNNPGFYPMTSEDRLQDVVQSAGGMTADADPGQFRLYISLQEAESPQKVDINSAEAWLLQALPGIGETRAQAIIDYRQKHGRFRSTGELMQVEGIGAAVYEKIKPLITVAE